MSYCDKEIDKAAEAVIEKIARKLSNDILFGMNRKETNADRIRCMSDEELADEILRWFNWLNAVEWDDNRIIEWLKQEAET